MGIKTVMATLATLATLNTDEIVHTAYAPYSTGQFSIKRESFYTNECGMAF